MEGVVLVGTPFLVRDLVVGQVVDSPPDKRSSVSRTDQLLDIGYPEVIAKVLVNALAVTVSLLARSRLLGTNPANSPGSMSVIAI